jgi:hypothetical protein
MKRTTPQGIIPSRSPTPGTSPATATNIYGYAYSEVEDPEAELDVTITNSGNLTSNDDTNIYAYSEAYYDGAAMVTVNNSGKLISGGDEDYDGIYAYSLVEDETGTATTVVNNTGDIQSNGDAIDANAEVEDDYGDASVTVVNSGNLDVEESTGIEVYAYSYEDNTEVNITNSGDIDAENGYGISVDIYADDDATTTITNSGNIDSHSENIYIEGESDDVVTNSGVLTTDGERAIFTDEGDDIVNLRGAGLAVNGLIDGGDDFDLLSIEQRNACNELGRSLGAITGDASSGSGTFNGNTITWENFEEIDAFISQAGCDFIREDLRINRPDYDAPVALYCERSVVTTYDAEGLPVPEYIAYEIVDGARGGAILLRAPRSVIEASGVATDPSGASLTMAGAELVFSYNGYSYSFPSNICD